MEKYELDLSHSVVRSVPNDVYYIVLGEDPIDEENLAIAEKLASEFKNGFDIRLVGENEQAPGELLVKIIPYKKAEHSSYDGYDLICDLTTVHVMLLKLLDGDMLQVDELYKCTGQIATQGVAKLRTNKFGLKYFELGPEGRRNSVFYLNRFRPIK
jgi:hypothetical protein